jgi:hypothetical protein
MKKINLMIPVPCHQNWERMRQEEKGKFCSSCQKTVIDFTKMTDRELVEFFKTPRESVCGRLTPEQLRREFLQEGKKMPWLKYFFTISLPALLTFRASAQKPDMIVGKLMAPETIIRTNIDSVPQKTVVTKPMERVKNSMAISPKSVIGPAPAASTGARVKKLRRAEAIPIPLFDSPGFHFDKIPVQDPVLTSNMTSQEICNRVGGLVASVRVVRTPKAIIKKLIDTVQQKMTVYPNPVVSNSSFHIKVNGLAEGSYVCAIISAGG